MSGLLLSFHKHGLRRQFHSTKGSSNVDGSIYIFRQLRSQVNCSVSRTSNEIPHLRTASQPTTGQSGQEDEGCWRQLFPRAEYIAIRKTIRSKAKDIHFARCCLGLSRRNDTIVRTGFVEPFLSNPVILVALDTEFMRDGTAKEVGIATLDTRVLQAIKPESKASNWAKHIKVTHLGITGLFSSSSQTFLYGQSRLVTVDDLRDQMRRVFETSETAKECRYVLVGHSYISDARVLHKSIGFEPASTPSVIGVLDTNHILSQERLVAKLQELSESLKYATGQEDRRLKFHNAGNDALYTLECLLALAVTPERRWKRQEPFMLQGARSRGMGRLGIERPRTEETAVDLLFASVNRGFQAIRGLLRL